MAEDLQALMQRIQKDAVDKAENEAAAIIARAKEKAAEIVKAAEAEAAAKLEKADKDAEAFTERSERTLEQSARDLLLSVGKNLEKMILDLLNLQVEKSLDESTVKDMLKTLAKNYSSDIEVDFSEADAKKLTSFVTGEFAKELGKGVKVESDKGVKFGFRLCDGRICQGTRQGRQGRKRQGRQVRLPRQARRRKGYPRIYRSCHGRCSLGPAPSSTFPRCKRCCPGQVGSR